MKIEIINTGAAISFPFELKDAFRAAFPSAKWNSADKRWEVGSRSIKRLEQWSAEVESSGIIAEIADRDARELAADEVAQLNKQIAGIRELLALEIRKLPTLEKSAQARAGALVELETVREKLAEVRSKVAVAEQHADAVECSIEEIAAGVIDIQAIGDTLDSEAMGPKIAAALDGTGISAERFKRAALAALSRPEAAYLVEKCTRASIYAALMNAAAAGLEMHPALGQAYLVPRKDQATLQIGYKGFIALAARAGLRRSTPAGAGAPPISL